MSEHSKAEWIDEPTLRLAPGERERFEEAARSGRRIQSSWKTSEDKTLREFAKRISQDAAETGDMI